MKNKHKILLGTIVFVLLVTAVFWQYRVSKAASNREYKPMSVVMLLEPMSVSAEAVALDSKFVYIGSSNQKVTILKSQISEGQVILTLSGSGIIYDDSSIFAGQRLVYNTKINIHALFDAVGTVTNLEYTR
jgi:hypothetical protein